MQGIPIPADAYRRSCHFGWGSCEAHNGFPSQTSRPLYLQRFLGSISSGRNSTGEYIGISVTTVKPSLFISLFRGGIEGRMWEESGVVGSSHGGDGQWAGESSWRSSSSVPLQDLFTLTSSRESRLVNRCSSLSSRGHVCAASSHRWRTRDATTPVRAGSA